MLFCFEMILPGYPIVNENGVFVKLGAKQGTAVELFQTLWRKTALELIRLWFFKAWLWQESK